MVIAKFHLYSEGLQATQHLNRILCWQVFQLEVILMQQVKQVGTLQGWEKKCGGELKE